MTTLRVRTLAGVPIGGYDVVDGDTVIGWVIRDGSHWNAYVARRDRSSPTGRRVGWNFFRTRRDAVAEVEIQREV